MSSRAKGTAAMMAAAITVYTVLSGVFYIGLGDVFDPDRLEAFPPGDVVVLPGSTSHFH